MVVLSTSVRHSIWSNWKAAREMLSLQSTTSHSLSHALIILINLNDQLCYCSTEVSSLSRAELGVIKMRLIAVVVFVVRFEKQVHRVNNNEMKLFHNPATSKGLYAHSSRHSTHLQCIFGSMIDHRKSIPNSPRSSVDCPKNNERTYIRLGWSELTELSYSIRSRSFPSSLWSCVQSRSIINPCLMVKGSRPPRLLVVRLWTHDRLFTLKLPTLHPPHHQPGPFSIICKWTSIFYLFNIF